MIHSIYKKGKKGGALARGGGGGGKGEMKRERPYCSSKQEEETKECSTLARHMV